MKAGAFPVWGSSLLVCPLVGYALLLVLVLSGGSIDISAFAVVSGGSGDVLVGVSFSGSQRLKLPVVFVLPHSSLVHQWC